MATVDVDGVTLFYERKGNGSPVVFVHGTVSDCRVWASCAAALAAHYTTLAYSRRYAHPNRREGDLRDSTVSANAKDLAGLIEGLGLAPVHLVGHSYGGFIAAYLAIQQPELLRSLTLIHGAVATLLAPDTSASSSLRLLFRSPGVARSARRFVKGVEATLRSVGAGDAPRAVDIFLTQSLQEGRPEIPRFPPEIRDMLITNVGTVRELTMPFPPVTRAEVSRIRLPTLIVYGDGSARWDVRISEDLASTIPGCEVMKIPGAGHFCLVENAEAVNARLLSFLQTHG